ncbi:MAG: hypothetical protein QGG34_14850 [SAR202 cluster bacterium]|jgi:hypothetical protein|nr:hypothetical protein [SAR202 cluster bacterium]MDP6299880.1 hypothetical protein [SAR202 cluster bacterium]MDP7414254.1 hypothetical protein [SAR202 cluster bacterium]
MSIPIKALFVNGKIDEDGQLHLDEPVADLPPSRVGVVSFVTDDSDISEKEWLHLLMSDPDFDFLKDPEEDIYTLDDGKPFIYEG